jgi:hypothetical protein
MIFHLDNQLLQIINQTNKTIDIQTISTPLIQIGEQLSLALVRRKKKVVKLKYELNSFRNF